MRTVSAAVALGKRRNRREVEMRDLGGDPGGDLGGDLGAAAERADSDPEDEGSRLPSLTYIAESAAECFDSLPVKVKLNCYGFVVAWAITFIVMFATSFKYVSELQYCIRYGTISQRVDPYLYNDGQSGTYFIGIDHNFVCYPKNRQRLIYTTPSQTEEENTVLEEKETSSQYFPLFEARTLEGLPLRMEVAVDYKLDRDGILELYNLTGANYIPYFQTAIFGAMQNVASKIEATQFLGRNRSHAARKFAVAANATAKSMYAEVLNVHLFHVDLPDLYENTIREIYMLRLEQQQAMQLRELQLMNETNEYLKAQIDLETDITVKLIDIEREINNARLNREGAVTRALTDSLVLQKQILRNRDIKLINLEKDIEVAKRNRILKVTDANNQKERASIRFQRELLQARSEALIRAIEAGAQSYERRSNGTAKANALKYKYDAQLSLFKALKDSVNMTSKELLQYAWVEATKQTNNGDLFVDYKKVPMFAEVTPRVGSQNGGDSN
jgi:hypothetical protein